MRLKNILRSLTVKSIANFKDIEIQGIATDSRLVRPGEIFIAIRGAQVDGYDFINEAVERGVSCLVVGEAKAHSLAREASDVVIIGVADTRKTLISLAGSFYQDKIQGLKLIGITGTNGKTTITYLIESILQRAGFKTGLIGTIDCRLPGRQEKSVNTTPGLNDLYRYFLEMKKARVQYCIMEVSSHALEQQRVGALKFHRAIFTNLSRDHLDYHKNFANYFAAKRKLFTMLEQDKGCAIINQDDAYGRRLAQLKLPHKITYGINAGAQVRAYNIEATTASTSCLVSYKNKVMKLKSKLVGGYNVYNLLASVALALSMKIRFNDIIEGVRRLKDVPGRLQLVGQKQKVRIFVDYAHTPAAMRLVLNFLKSEQKRRQGRVILVFGCGGQRDKIKRPQMGLIGSSLADLVILTTDNPRSENPRDIAEDIKKGIRKNNYQVILDRYEAIKKALKEAIGNDIVLIAGKGHEQVQIFKNKIEYFDDRDAVKRALVQIKGRHV